MTSMNYSTLNEDNADYMAIGEVKGHACINFDGCYGSVLLYYKI